MLCQNSNMRHDSLFTFVGLLGLPTMLLMVAGCDSSQPISSGPLVLVDKYNFQSVVARSERPVLVEFGSPRCEPCKILEPMLVSLATKHAGQLTFVKINTDANEAIAKEFRIESVPTIIIFKSGRVVKRHVGVPQSSELAGMIKPYLAAQE